MRCVAWLVSLGVCACRTTPHDDPLDRRALLQRELDAYRAQGHFNGGVLAASFGDGALIVVASGNVAADARMMVGSITKTFVAGHALQLVGDGRLRLDEPVATYLALKPWVGRIPNGSRVTIRMLLNHTSGYGDCQRPVDNHFEVIQCLVDGTPVDEPARAFRYSNMNYDLMAGIEETVTGDSSADDLAQHIFRPLGLTSTTLNDSVPYWGSASAMSSAGDLARWIRDYSTGQVFPPRLWAEVMRTVPAASPYAPLRRRGLGIEVDSEATGRTIGHGGLFTGYRSEARYYVDLDLALAIMVNTDGDLPGWRREPLAHIATALARRRD